MRAILRNLLFYLQKANTEHTFEGEFSGREIVQEYIPAALHEFIDDYLVIREPILFKVFLVKERRKFSLASLRRHKDGSGLNKDLVDLYCWYIFNCSYKDAVSQKWILDDIPYASLITSRDFNEYFDTDNSKSDQPSNDKPLPSQPLLFIFNTEEYHNKLLFKSRYSSFVGRGSELKQLESFWIRDSTFEWGVITGPGGSGKSRLALQFCEQLSKAGDYAGFITDLILLQFDWVNWLPNKDTFIVIDYVETHHEQIIKSIRTILIKKQFYIHKVRILLLEREKKGRWWERFMGEVSEEHFKNLALDLTVKGLDQQELLEVIRVVSKNENSKINLRKIFATFKSIDRQRRPLFAILAALLHLENDKFSGDTIEVLIQSYYNRELYLFSQKNERLSRDISIIEKHKNLLVLCTLAGAIPLTKLSVLLETYSWLPNKDEFNVSAFEHFAAITLNGGLEFFNSVQPDILGEYFVVQTLLANPLNPFTDYQWRSDIIHVAFELSRDNVCNFWYRALSDFPRYVSSIKSLFPSPKQIHIDVPEKKWIDLLSSLLDVNKMKLNQINTRAYYNCLAQYAKDSLSDTALKHAFFTAFDLFHYQRQNDIIESEFYYEEIRQLGQLITDKKFYENQLSCLSILINQLAETNVRKAQHYLNSYEQEILTNKFASIKNVANNEFDTLSFKVRQAASGENELKLLTSQFDASKIVNMIKHGLSINDELFLIERIITENLKESNFIDAVNCFKAFKKTVKEFSHFNDKLVPKYLQLQDLIINAFLKSRKFKAVLIFYPYLSNIFDVCSSIERREHEMKALSLIISFLRPGKDRKLIIDYFECSQNVLTAEKSDTTITYYFEMIYNVLLSESLPFQNTVHILEECYSLVLEANTQLIWGDFFNILRVFLISNDTYLDDMEIEKFYTLLNKVIVNIKSVNHWKSLQELYSSDFSIIQSIFNERLNKSFRFEF